MNNKWLKNEYGSVILDDGGFFDDVKNPLGIMVVKLQAIKKIKINGFLLTNAVQ